MSAAPVQLARRLGWFDATMIVMGGIVGSGIFINPHVVALQVHTPALILGVWILGGLIALAGAFIYAELALLRPLLGGQYAYLREAYHPSVAFLYGWTLLLVTQTGGMAAVAVTFARYAREITHTQLSDGAIASIALGALTMVNCLGVRSGSAVQNSLMMLKTIAIAALVIAGFIFIAPHSLPLTPLLERPPSLGLLSAIGAACTPVLFAYGGWQGVSFLTAEVRNPRRDLPRGLVLGVCSVIVLYLSVNVVFLRALGPDGLAATSTPASAVMRLALGETGGFIMALAIAVSTLGFLSHGMLTAPRVYFAMAKDGLFFRSVAWLPASTRVPVVAIALQGVMAVIIALSGRYEQILNYVVSIDFIFFGLTATCLFRFHKSESRRGVPGHPFTTIFFIASCWLVVIGTFYNYPRNSFIGLGILVLGMLVYPLWRRKSCA